MQNSRQRKRLQEPDAMILFILQLILIPIIVYCLISYKFQGAVKKVNKENNNQCSKR